MAKTAAPTGIEKARKLNLNVNDLRVLKALSDGPLFQFELVERLKISKQALSYNIEKMSTPDKWTKAVYVTRGEDKKISITDAGRKAVAGIA